MGSHATRCEPTLDEMLADPIVQVLMQRDGVRDDDLRLLVRDVANRLLPEGAAPPADEAGGFARRARASRRRPDA